jgi:hypothetical protein
MMGGLAYMTGLPDRPLRAGSSVVDIMGGTFAAVAILAALRSRESTGRGMLVTSALFESTAYLVAQHMAQFEITGEAPPPMSVKRPAWGVYDIFETAGGGRLFIGVVTDTQWEAFCRDFGLVDLFEDSRLRTNGQRAKERAWLIPRLNELTREHPQEELAARLEAIGMPFAPIAKPWDLLDDPHLNASGGLLETRARGKTIRVPALPVSLDGERLAKRADPPRVGEHARELLESLGCSQRGNRQPARPRYSRAAPALTHHRGGVMKLKAVLAGIAAAGIAFAAAAQERPPYGTEVTLDQAKKIAAGANAESKKNGWRMAIAVVDNHGFLVYYERMDDTQTGSIDVAIDKAKAAAMYRRPTKAFEDGIAKGRNRAARVARCHPDRRRHSDHGRRKSHRRSRRERRATQIRTGPRQRQASRLSRSSGQPHPPARHGTTTFRGAPCTNASTLSMS